MQSYEEQAKKIRKQIIEIGYNLGRSGMHFGPTLSLVEIMMALYETMSYNANQPDWEDRDRLILSKGHGVLAQYITMKQHGMLKNVPLESFKKDFELLSAHPSRHPEIGIDFSSGSLGQGLSLGLGSAIALKKKCRSARVFVVLGDGECDEGSVWEAVMAAAQYNTSNLIAVIDLNGFQYDGPTSNIINLKSLREKFMAFGWDAEDVDGHDVEKMKTALDSTHKHPFAIIAHTIKGKGISFMENDASWHNKALTQKLYEQAIQELGEVTL